jgi:hypothetical protein
MKKLFIVTSDPTSEEQDKVFQEWIEAEFNWWHWLQQTWMLVDEYGVHTALEIRDKARDTFPGVYLMVFEISRDRSTWAGWGANSEKRNMFAWIIDNWNV